MLLTNNLLAQRQTKMNKIFGQFCLSLKLNSVLEYVDLKVRGRIHNF